MKLFDSDYTYPNLPTADGQTCNLDRGRARPTAGARQSWVEPAATLDSYGANLVLTRWADGPAALRDLQKNTGECLLSDSRTDILVTSGRYDVVLSNTQVFSARLVGNVVVSTTVNKYQQSPGADALLAEARAYTDRVADRLTAAGG